MWQRLQVRKLRLQERCAPNLLLGLCANRRFGRIDLCDFLYGYL